MSRLKRLKSLRFLGGKLSRQRVQSWAVAYIAGTPNVETFMFVIHTRVLDEKATVVSTAVAAGHFADEDISFRIDRDSIRPEDLSGRVAGPSEGTHHVEGIALDDPDLLIGSIGDEKKFLIGSKVHIPG